MVKYNNKNHSKVGKETEQEKIEKLEKIQTFIKKIERKNVISSPKPNITTISMVENLFYRTDASFNKKNSSLYSNTHLPITNTKFETILKKPLSNSEIKYYKPNSLRKSFFSPSARHNEKNKETIKPFNETFDYEDSFNLINTNNKIFAIPISNKIKKKSKMDIREITQIDANLVEETKNTCTSTNNVEARYKRFKNQKLRIVSNRVKNNLIEWKNVKISHKFHSGNFDLPLYTLSK